MPGDPRRVALVQMAMSERREDNLAKALAMVREAVLAGARLILLPELFLSRYFCQSEDEASFALAEPVPDPSTEAFLPLAAESGATLVLSLFERRAPGLYHNTAAVIDGASGYAGKYRKMHIPDDPLYYEKFYFTPGDLGFKSFETAHGKDRQRSIGVRARLPPLLDGRAARSALVRRTAQLQRGVLIPILIEVVAGHH